ncbi:MAG: cytochrome-c peroxidase, partial [Rhizobiaceae bacterium]
MNRLAACAAAFLLWIGPSIAGELPEPLTDEDFRAYSKAQVKLGRLLFYDRILSGTFRVSCATCHNHDRASSNGVRLDGKEEERDDLAVNGEPVYEPFKPSAKHAPTLFNLGAKQFTRMFSDGRVERLPDGSFLSPAGNELPEGLSDVLAVQALFPAAQGNELLGKVENDLIAVAHKGNQAIWDALAKRVSGTKEYWPHFELAYPELKNADDITIVEIANAIGAFVGTEWRSDDAPFDRYLRGDEAALTGQQKRGMDWFYGKAKCDTCHSGALQTDHRFYRRTLSPLQHHSDALESLHRAFKEKVADKRPLNRAEADAVIPARRTPS